MNLLAIKQRFGIIGNSPLLEHALQTAVRVAATDLTVLITGESGVGKEAFSKIIHQLSSRKHNNFIAVNCGAIPSGTINSELFGHEKGAFTGAMGDRKGYFETADGGTIFLDEVGEMPLDTQAFLLRVLESGEFMRVGASKTQLTNVRVVAATNIDLKESISRGKFREDLYYRLNTVPIHVPSLRERREDIYLLFRKFVSDFSEKYRTTPIQLDESAQRLLENYAWKGNIRELKNVAEQVSVLAQENTLNAQQLGLMIPVLMNRNLPSMVAVNAEQGGGFQEREILYKLLFDMKGDLNDLKALVFELMKNNNLSVANTNALRALQSSFDIPRTKEMHHSDDFLHSENEQEEPTFQHQSVIIEPKNRFQTTDTVDESLSLEDMEKEMIERALKKHKGRRKDAAIELGISERTLYRKIKQYDLDE